MSRLSVLLLLLVIAVPACGGSPEELVARDVVSHAPWAGAETARYRLLRGDDVVGTAVLSLEPQGDVLAVGQRFEFPDEEVTNDASAVVSADGLQPQSVEFVIDGPEGQRRCQATYAGSRATVQQRSEEGERTDELDVPLPSYDSWSDLFLWRTLAFSAGYEVTYSDVLTCTLAKPQVLRVALKVTGLETVAVPAGAHEAWRLEIRSGGRTQRAWYASDQARTLVRYDNGDLVFELESND